MNKDNKFFRIAFILLVLLIVLTSLKFYSMDGSSLSEKESHNLSLENKETIPNFWNLTEIQSIPLNITYTDVEYYWNETVQKNFTLQHLFYTSQYWNNSALRVHGVLLLPDNSSGDLEKLPGILLMHGLGGSYIKMIESGYVLAAHNYCVLLIDHPGHGLSDGPFPSSDWLVPDVPENYTITPDLLNRTHFYLVARSAVRAVDVLLNQTYIDSQKICTMGGSYGGIASMFASNIYWSKVKTAIPIIAAGDLKTGFSTDYTFFHLIVNTNEKPIDSPGYSYLYEYFDPIRYVNTPNNPPTLFICGTNDEFFPLNSFNATFTKSTNNLNAISMTPGGHHGFLLYPSVGSILYWLNYTLGNGIAPPEIQVSREITNTLLGSKLTVSANIETNATISKVKLAYRREFAGLTWNELEMTQTGNNSWNIEVSSLPINTQISYYVIVELEDEEYIMFSSHVWKDALSTWIEIPFIILIALGSTLIIFLVLRHDIKKNKQKIPKSNQNKLHLIYILQITTSEVTEFFILMSFLSPLVILLPESNAFGISMLDILNVYIDFIPILSIILLLVIIIGYILSMTKPILGGIVNIIPPLILIIGSSLLFNIFADSASIIGLELTSIILSNGIIIWIVMCIIQISFDVFKRIYKKRLFGSKKSR